MVSDDKLNTFLTYFMEEKYKEMFEYYLQTLHELPKLTSIIYALKAPYNQKMAELFLFSPLGKEAFERLSTVIEKDPFNPLFAYCKTLELNDLSNMKNSILIEISK